MTCDLSVLVAAHDEEAYIREALESVFAQGLHEFEIVVVDDGSSDDTGAIVAALASMAPARIALRQVRHDVSRGLAHARNTALEAARGVHVVLLDADDAFAPGALAALRTRLDHNRSAKLAFPRYQWMASDGSPLRVTSPHVATAIDAADILCDNPIHSDTGVMAARADLSAIGGFDTQLTGYVGADAWVRFAWAYGASVMVCEPAGSVRYRRHEAQITRDWRRMERNWRLLEAKFEREHARAFAPIRAQAGARHHLYCAHLARAAGERQAARRLLASALKAEPALMLKRRDAARLALASAVDCLRGA